MKNIVIFLGAGASKADGAPLQGELFKSYFEMRKIKKEERRKYAFFGMDDGYDINDERTKDMDIRIEDCVKNFFKYFFNINENSDNFPTFEEALGILDLAENRKEVFYDFNRTCNFDTLNSINYFKERMSLILSMAETIEYKLEESKGRNHELLINNLYQNDLLNSTAFISTNYDILIDNALLNSGNSINYGFNKTKIFNNNISLNKIHGSLNWLYCPVCKEIKITDFIKGTLKLVTAMSEAKCNNCGVLTEAIIVPPTFFKNYQNVYLNNVWNNVENILNNAEHIIFCGYSFPDADIYIKYLIKRSEIYHKKDKINIKISIVNSYKRKRKYEKNDEKLRYERFFSNQSIVNYTDYSFEDFVSNPSLIINK